MSLPSSLMFYYRLHQEREASEKLTAIRYEIERVDELLTQLLNLETGVRGYASTGDERFLDPYWEGKRQIPLLLSESDDINPAVDRLIQLADSTIQSPTPQNFREGKAVMDEIRRSLAAIQKKDRLARDRLIADRQWRQRLDVTLAIAVVGSTSVLLYLIYQAASDMRSAFTKAEEALEIEEAALKKERSLSSAKDSFMQTVAHEYRTPLTAILTAVELLDISTLSSERKAKYLDQIRAGVRRLTLMIDDLLDIFRLDTGVQLHPTAIDLQHWFQALGQTLGTSDRLRISVDLDAQEITCDESMFHRVFSNLVSNALKYSDGAVEVRVRRVADGIEIRVRDSGIGIPQSTRLFEPFERGMNVGKLPGTGLGLSITKRAVDLLGGAIAIKSQEGKGTDVAVVLPVQKAAS